MEELSKRLSTDPYNLIGTAPGIVTEQNLDLETLMLIKLTFGMQQI
jgi:hypothetical protein